MIFVTEDFLTEKQVKNDHYKNPKSVSILKNNQISKFPTGIYDYSIMKSVFTPIDIKEFPLFFAFRINVLPGFYFSQFKAKGGNPSKVTVY